MSAVSTLLRNTSIPPLVPVVCRYEDNGIRDIPRAVALAMDNAGLESRLPKEGEIAIGVGSRGLAAIDVLVRETIAWFKSKRLRPFIVPCMGSHGGATAEGQTQVLAALGVTEERCGAPIRASMDVVQIGELDDGMPVYLDSHAAKADGVFVLNRIKPHPSFSGTNESGLVKMITIGLGKQRGADSCHTLGFGAFNRVMPAMTRLILEKQHNILGGLASVENAYDVPCHIEAIRAENFLRRDAELLLYARDRMPAIPVTELDVLLVDYIGKNISGSGMDPNITGRHASNNKSGGPVITRVALLDLTLESNGNATGMGNADIITKRLYDAVDYDYTYANVVTSTLLRVAFTPVVLSTDHMVIAAAVKTCNAGNRPVRFIRIKDTLTLDKMLVSPVLAAELASVAHCNIVGEPSPMRFDTAGTLLDRDVWTTLFPAQ